MRFKAPFKGSSSLTSQDDDLDLPGAVQRLYAFPACRGSQAAGAEEVYQAQGADGGVKRWRMNDNEIPPDTHTENVYIYVYYMAIYMDGPGMIFSQEPSNPKNVPSEHYTMSFLFYGLRLRGLSGSIEKCCSFLLIRFEHGLGY